MPMPPAKRWQLRIEISSVNPIPNWEMPKEYLSYTLYGETIGALRASARDCLSTSKCTHFRNQGDHILGQVTYFDSDALSPENELYALTHPHGSAWWYQQEKMLKAYAAGTMKYPAVRLGSFREAVNHFIVFSLIPEKGPDYQSRAMVGNNLRLPLIEKVLREGAEHPVNDLMQRGWHIIALEYAGETSIAGELLNRRAIFVMGHPEIEAANITLGADYFKERL